jgi:hypothetical protein
MLEHSSNISRALLGRIHDSEIQSVCLYSFGLLKRRRKSSRPFKAHGCRCMQQRKIERASTSDRLTSFRSQSLGLARQAVSPSFCPQFGEAFVCSSSQMSEQGLLHADLMRHLIDAQVDALFVLCIFVYSSFRNLLSLSNASNVSIRLLSSLISQLAPLQTGLTVLLCFASSRPDLLVSHVVVLRALHGSIKAVCGWVVSECAYFAVSQAR